MRTHNFFSTTSALMSLAVACLACFAGLTVAAVRYTYFWYDPPLERAVQALPLPLAEAVRFYGWMQGLRQVGLAVAGILLVLLLNRQGALLMAGGAISAAPYQLLDVLVHRPRPDPHLVHVVAATPSYSFPSGHTVFFTWFSALLVLTLGRRLAGPARWAAWLLVAAVVGVTALSRVWAGAHWPSDVAAGFLLGTGWTLLVVAAGRRWLPQATRAH